MRKSDSKIGQMGREHGTKRKAARQSDMTKGVYGYMVSMHRCEVHILERKLRSWRRANETEHCKPVGSHGITRETMRRRDRPQDSTTRRQEGDRDHENERPCAKQGNRYYS